MKVAEFHLGAKGSLNPQAADGFDYPGESVSVGSLEGDTVWGALPASWKKDIQTSNPGEAVLARVEIGEMAHLFKKGSKLRVWIDTPSDTGGFKFSTFGVKQKLFVLHNEKYDSVIRLGELSDVTPPKSASECGKVLSQPCRLDPMAQAKR